MKFLAARKLSTVVYAAITALSITSASAHAVSLEQAVATALETHPDIKLSFARFKSKEEDTQAAKAGYLPSIDLTAGYGYEYTDTPGNRRSELGYSDGETELKRGEFGLSLRQLVFDGMLTSSEINRARFEAHADKWALISVAENLALSVSQSYLSYIKAQELVTLAQKNVATHQEIWDQIKERTDAGLGSIADLSQISGRLARAQSNLIAAQNNLADAQDQFVRLTNMMPDNLVMPVPDADMLPGTKAEGLTWAMDRHPTIKSARQDIHAARAQHKATKSSLYPTITLEVTANANNDIAGEDGFNRIGANVGGHRNDAAAMLRLRYNLYAGGRNTAEQKSAAYKISEAQQVNYRAHRQVKEGYSLAWNAYQMLGQQLGFIQRHVETSKETQIAYKEQFNLGQRSLLDLLDTENELFLARQDYLDASFNEVAARYRLLNATGQLLDSLRVTRAATWHGELDYSQSK